jgi:hypothetical protein
MCSWHRAHGTSDSNGGNRDRDRHVGGKHKACSGDGRRLRQVLELIVQKRRFSRPNIFEPRSVSIRSSRVRRRNPPAIVRHRQTTLSVADPATSLTLILPPVSGPKGVLQAVGRHLVQSESERDSAFNRQLESSSAWHIDVDTLGLLFNRERERTKIIGEPDDLPLLIRRSPGH